MPVLTTTTFSPKQQPFLMNLMILMSPYCYLAPYAGVEAAYMESFLENSSPKGKSDDDVAVPK